MKLLDGSLSGTGGSNTGSGPKFGYVDATLNGALVTSNIAGIKVATSGTAATKEGSETAIWDQTGKTLTLNLSLGKVYNQEEIDEIISKAKQEDSTAGNTPAEVKVTLNNGTFTSVANTAGGAGTVGGHKSSGTGTMAAGTFVGANTVTITSNKYGIDQNFTFSIAFDVAAGKEEVETDKDQTYGPTNAITQDGEFTIHLAAGK